MYDTYLLKNNNTEKTACDIVNEVFEKEAKLNFAKKKNLGKTIKNTLTGKNIKNAINDISVAAEAGAGKDTLKRLTKDRNKEIAKTVGAYGAGILGGTGSIALGKSKTKSEIEKRAFEMTF